MAKGKVGVGLPVVLSDYVTGLSTEARERYCRKLRYDNFTKILADPYKLSDKWSNNPNTWPDLTFGDIYFYLVDTPSIYTEESMRAYKSLDSFKFVSPIFDDLYGAYIDQLKKKKFFSILIDGATENELIYVRSLSDSGIPENHYLSIEDIQHAHADGILECIETAFNRCGMDDWKDRLIGFGSDGASVNLGVRGGVAVKLKEHADHLIITHCVSHRLELAATNAIKEHRFMRDVQDLLNNVYKQYHYSPKALRELRLIAESLEEKILKPGNLHGTRWLPHVHRALDILVKDYTVIIAHFEHIITTRSATAEVQGRASNVSKKLKDFSFLYMTFFMLDVLNILSELSLSSQKDNVTLGQMIDAITSTHLSLVELKSENGDALSSFLHDVTHDNCFKTIQLTNIKHNDDFKQRKEDIIGKISQAINQRFRVMETDPIMTAAAKILSLQEYPTDRDTMATYATTELNLLVEHFTNPLTEAGCTLNNVGKEFKDFKAYLLRNKAISFQSILQNDDLRQRLPNLLMLMEILLVFPISSASCERGFSAMKPVKSDWRSKLAPEILRKLLFIVIEGPTVDEFNTARVMDRWWSSGRAKRPGFNPYDFM